MRLSVCLSLCVCMCVSVCLSLYTWLRVCFCVPACLPISLSTGLPFYLPACLSGLVCGSRGEPNGGTWWCVLLNSTGGVCKVYESPRILSLNSLNNLLLSTDLLVHCVLYGQLLYSSFSFCSFGIRVKCTSTMN